MGLKRDLIILLAMIVALSSFTTAWYINTLTESRKISLVEYTPTSFIVLQANFVYQGSNKVTLTLELKNNATVASSADVQIQPIDWSGNLIEGCTPASMQNATTGVIPAGGTWTQGFTFTKSGIRSLLNVFQIIISGSGYVQTVYYSGGGTTVAPKSMIAYLSTTLSGARYPKYRFFDLSWSDEQQLLDAVQSNILEIRGEFNPIPARRDNAIFVTLSVSGYIDAYTYDGASWLKTTLGRIGTSVTTPTRPFDVTYENTTGRALVVYNNQGKDGAKDIAYRVWDGSTWSAEAYLQDPTEGKQTYYWIQLASKLRGGSTEIAMVGLSSNMIATAWIWDGSSFGNMQRLNDSSNLVTNAIYEGCGVQYEYNSGHIMAFSVKGANIRYSQWGGSSWSTVQNVQMGTGNINFITVKSQRIAGSDRIMVLSLDDKSDVYARPWDGMMWNDAAPLDNSMQTATQRCIDGDWEPTGEQFIAVGGNSGVAAISYKTWTPTGGWTPTTQGTWSTFAGLTTAQSWIQVRSNPKAADPPVLIGTLDSGNDIVVTTWTGTIMTNQIEATAASSKTYEAFEISNSYP